MAYFIINHLGAVSKHAQCDAFSGFMRLNEKKKKVPVVS